MQYKNYYEGPVKNHLSSNRLLYFIVIANIICSALFLIYSDGHAWIRLLFNNINYSVNDSSMDFFNSIYHAYGLNPYISVDRIYPAFTYLIYYAISKFIPTEVCSLGAQAIKSSVNGGQVFLLYNVLMTISGTLLIQRFTKGEYFKKTITAIMLIFSAPFIFQFERGNIIFLVLLVLMGFMILNTSQNRVWKEISLILLAMASVIKIYPAIFSIVLLRKRKFWEFLRFAIYAIALFVIPFAVMGGIETILKMFNYIQYSITLLDGNGFAYKVNIENTVLVISSIFNVSIPHFAIKYLLILLLAISLINSILVKAEWKSTLLLVLLMAGIPGFSFYYTMIFMSIPLIQFLNTKKYNSKSDYLWSIYFALSMAPLLYIDDTWFSLIGDNVYRYNLHTFIAGMLVIVGLIVVNFAGIKELYKNFRNNKRLGWLI